MWQVPRSYFGLHTHELDPDLHDFALSQVFNNSFLNYHLAAQQYRVWDIEHSLNELKTTV
jgi:hypothetical protein